MAPMLSALILIGFSYLIPIYSRICATIFPLQTDSETEVYSASVLDKDSLLSPVDYQEMRKLFKTL